MDYQENSPEQKTLRFVGNIILAIFLVTTWISLLFNANSITPMSLLAASVPSLVSLLRLQGKGPFLRVIRMIILVVDVIVIIIALLETNGLLTSVEKTAYYEIGLDSFVFKGQSFSKQWIVWPMALNISIPFLDSITMNPRSAVRAKRICDEELNKSEGSSL